MIEAFKKSFEDQGVDLDNVEIISGEEDFLHFMEDKGVMDSDLSDEEKQNYLNNVANEAVLISGDDTPKVITNDE